MLEEPQGTVKLNLEKYSLSHLKNKNPSAWSASDIQQLIDAFAAEDISPTVRGLPFTAYNVKKLLGTSNCRRCGKCCLPNPLNPEHPGVMVYKEDLIKIAKHSHYSYKYLKKKAILNTNPNLAPRRYLPLPCMFYDKTKSECQIYDIRPLVCRTFPITDLPRQVGISINVRCEYGRDIYRNVINLLKKKPMLSKTDL